MFGGDDLLVVKFNPAVDECIECMFCYRRFGRLSVLHNSDVFFDPFSNSPLPLAYVETSAATVYFISTGSF